MSIQYPHVLNVKFCKHHRNVGRTDQIADFLYGCVVPLEEAGIDVIKAGLACGCTVWMRHDEKMRALPAAPPTVGSGTPAAQKVCRTKGRAHRVECTCVGNRRKYCAIHGSWLFDV